MYHYEQIFSFVKTDETMLFFIFFFIYFVLYESLLKKRVIQKAIFNADWPISLDLGIQGSSDCLRLDWFENFLQLCWP